MKKHLLSLILGILVLLFSCKKDEVADPSGGFPDKIIIDIPESISSVEAMKSASLLKESPCLPISADSIYWNVRNFIGIGEFSAQIVQEIITALKRYNLSKPQEITFTSNDDAKEKKIVVVDNGIFEDIVYDLKLTLTDVASGKIAMQLFWFKTKTEGVAIVCPAVFNTIDKEALANPNLMYRVDYSGTATQEYDQKMCVTLSGFTITSDVFSVDKIKMEVYRKDDLITLKGNSNHPQAYFYKQDQKGFSYAFVAKGDRIKNIGVINLALPSCTYQSADVFNNYSVSKIFEAEINAYVEANSMSPSEPLVQACISNALSQLQSPAYYGSEGYKACGAVKPDASYEGSVSDLNGLQPFIPSEVNNLGISFAE